MMKRRCLLLSSCPLSAAALMVLLLLVLLANVQSGSAQDDNTCTEATNDQFEAYERDALYIEDNPRTYRRGDQIPLWVNTLTSIHTQIPKDYYRLPFCWPEGGVVRAQQNLGEVLTGNKIQNAPFQINMLDEVVCRKLCQVQLTALQAARLSLYIKYGYNHNWILDNLPSSNLAVSWQGRRQKHFAGGFPIGIMSADTSKAYIYNHVNINIEYHACAAGEGYRIVDFAVEPLSVNHKFQGGFEWDGLSVEGLQTRLATCPSGGEHMDREYIESLQIVNPGETILYTYDVIWRKSQVPWASRWEVYLTEDHLVRPQVHWYSITNSLSVVVILVCVIMCRMVRQLKRDVEAYKAQTEEDPDDSFRWKAIYGDVFRPPMTRPVLYCVFVGSGVQLALTLLSIILLAVAGWVSPARRGWLLTAALMLYPCLGIAAGYVSGRLYKTFGGKDWERCSIMTASVFPGIAFGFFLLMNILFWWSHATAAVGLWRLLQLIAIWALIMVPSTHLGTHLACQRGPIEVPTITNPVARAIPPPTRCYYSPTFGVVVCGILLFAASYVELFFIMASLWMNQYYYVYNCALVVFIIMVITSVQVTALSVYTQVYEENHLWWWHAMFCGGSVGFYVFLYTTLWFSTLEPPRMITTYLVYFGYNALMAFCIFLIFGSISALTSFWLLRRIYAAIGFESEAERIRQGYSELQMQEEDTATPTRMTAMQETTTSSTTAPAPTTVTTTISA